MVGEYFSSNVDFDPNEGEYCLGLGDISLGAFILKINADEIIIKGETLFPLNINEIS